MSSESTGGGTYRLEPLNATNWMPWKRRMEAVLREQNLLSYITPPTSIRPVAGTITGADNVSVTITDTQVTTWETGESKARTRLELAIGDTEMAHILGATTAGEIWTRLLEIKETKGRLGILAVRRALYRAAAAEGFDMVEHISNLRAYQAELALMSNVVTDEDFAMVIITSLPESWDGYTSAYFGSHGSEKSLKASEIIPLLLEEDRRRRAKDGGAMHALQANFRAGGGGGSGGRTGGGAKGSDREKECYNCKGKGHVKKDCWAKGGGAEGKGPRGRRRKDRTNQAKDKGADINTAVAVAYMTRFNEVNTSKLVWYLDSGTTSHICTHRDAFTDYTTLHNTTVQGVGPAVAIVEGTGTVQINFKVGDLTYAHSLKDVLYVPGAPNCLLSLSRFDEGGGSVAFSKGGCELKDRKGRVVGLGRKVDRLYQLDARARLWRERANYAAPAAKSWDHWHLLFGHIGMSTLEKMQRMGIVGGFDVDESSIPSPTCTACLGAKLTHQPFPKKADWRSRIAGEGYHCDVWGPIKTESIWKNRYYVSFTDDATRMVQVYFMKEKGEASKFIAEHVAAVERKFGKGPAWMRFDNGKELVNSTTKSLCATKGIEIHTTAPYSPSQNGVAERLNRTLLELVRAMMIAKSVPAFLWDEAVSHAVYLRNRVLTSALPGRTPYEAYHGKKPDVSFLREFGSDVWVLDESTGRSKLSPRSNKMMFVGFVEGSQAVRYYEAKRRSVKVSRNVAFNENKVVEVPRDGVPHGLGLEEELSTPDGNVDPKSGNDSTHMDPPPSPIRPPEILRYTPEPRTPPAQPFDNFPIPEPVHDRPQSPRRTRNHPDIDYRVSSNPNVRIPAARPGRDALKAAEEVRRTKERRATRRSKHAASGFAYSEGDRALYSKVGMEDVEDPDAPDSAPIRPARTPPPVYDERPWVEDVQDVDAPLPRSVKEALGGSEGKEWERAIEEELGMLEKMGTWEVVDLPSGREAVGNRWVFARKRDDHGQVVRYKARLVAQGFSQKPGTDFDTNGTFAPVMRFETFRTMTALASIHNWTMFQLDVKSAYLNGHLDEEIFMRQPPGYEDGTGRVCKLKRALYGLKQAGNVWNREFDSAMANLGFTATRSDPCCYIRRTGDVLAILLVWVDDIIGYTSSPAEATTITKELRSKFDINDIGQPGMLLGMKIHKDDDSGTITLSQSHYIDSMLVRFGLQDANSVTTPLDMNINLDSIDPLPIDATPDPRASSLYATAIGSLLYAAMGTRPDIAYAVHRLAQFTRSPQAKHWTAVKRVLRYLKGTRDLQLTYGDPSSKWTPELDMFCDADWASNADRKSVSGFVFTLAGGAVAWSSKKQTSVALSTAEAEYVAATHAAKQVLWYRALFDELGLWQPTTSTLFTDNQSAIAIAHNPQFHSRTKHIDIALHFLRDHVQSGTLNTVYVNTKDNLADILTKALPRPAHDDFTYRIGLLDPACTIKEEC